MLPDPASRPTSEPFTVLLHRWQRGDRAALDAVAPLIYRELRRIARRGMARAAGGDSLQPTGLVHEAWIRLEAHVGDFEDRAHFFAIAALAMRAVLIDRVRRLRALRHGGDRRRVPLAGVDPTVTDPREALLDGIALGEALDRLSAVAPDASTVATLRFLCDMSVDETAQTLGVSAGKVKKDWAFARAWLRRELKRGEAGDGAA